MITGAVALPKMDGQEVCPGIYLVGEPSVHESGDLRCLANVNGMLAVIALRLRFTAADQLDNSKHKPL